jgi:hypothetical protein
MFNKRPLPFPEFLENLQTLDVILMHGLFASSLSVESVEGCDWSHSAMVIVAKDIGLTGIDPETRLLWESNVLDIPEDAKRINPVLDVILKVPKDGPQLVKLSDRISHNITTNDDSDVGARKLYIERKLDMYATLNQVIQSVHSCHFPVSPDGDPGDGEMNNFIMGRFKNLPVTDNSFFCSQLLAHTFKALKLLTQQYTDNSYAPVDFSEALDVSFFNGAWLGREIMLDIKTVPPFPLKSA